MMRKFYLSFFAALLFALNGMAGDVVTFEEIEVNEDGYQNDFGDESCFELEASPSTATTSPSGTIGRASPSPAAQRRPLSTLPPTSTTVAWDMESMGQRNSAWSIPKARR